MKKLTLIFLLALYFCSTHVKANTNGYGITIGKKEIYQDTRPSEELVPVSRKLFIETDTLFASFYQCGGMAQSSVVNISIMNQYGEILKGTEIIQNFLAYYGYIPIRDILSNWKLNELTRLSIKLSIKENEHALARMYKIADLELVD